MWAPTFACFAFFTATTVCPISWYSHHGYLNGDTPASVYDNSSGNPVNLSAVKDPQELSQGHVPGPAPHAALENPAVLAPVTHALRSVACSRRALEWRRRTARPPSWLPSHRKCGLAATGRGAAGTTAGRCCGKRSRAGSAVVGKRSRAGNVRTRTRLTRSPGPSPQLQGILYPES